MPLPEISEISAFLFQFKFFAQTAPGFSLIERQKNIDSITDMGVTVPQLKSNIKIGAQKLCFRAGERRKIPGTRYLAIRI